MDRALVGTTLACVLILCCTIASGDEIEEGSVMLTGGSNGLQGYLQVYLGGEWGTVCNDQWDQTDADVVCRQLGANGGAMFAESGHSFSAVDSSLSVHVSMFKCKGQERRLTDCAHITEAHNCTHVVDVKMDCVLPSYKACVMYDKNDPPLKGRTHEPPDLTINKCAGLCRQDGYQYAGITQLKCHCGSVGEDYGSFGLESNDNCDDFCKGEGSQNCGAKGRLAIHDVAMGSCSGKFKGKFGAITSPEFPGSYPRDIRTCQWIVDVSDNGDTTIQFPVFEVAERDKLEITINGGKNWTMYEMTNTPKSMTFDKKEIRVKFTMKGTSSSNVGFVMTYEDDTTCDVITFPNGTLDTEEGVLYRPGDMVEVLCDKHFMSEWKYAACKEDGTWFKSPECIEAGPPGRSLVFTSTYLFMMLAVMGALGLIFFMVICGVICVGRKKKKEGYTGISRQESAEPTKAENEYHVDMNDGSDIDMQHARGDGDQGIPLASEAMDE